MTYSGLEAASKEGEKDDAELRRLALQAEVGPRSPEFNQKLLQIAAAEAPGWGARQGSADVPAVRLGEGNAITPTPAGNPTWVSMGPAASRSSYNGTYDKTANDTGRVTKLRAPPASARHRRGLRTGEGAQTRAEWSDRR